MICAAVDVHWLLNFGTEIEIAKMIAGYIGN